MLSFSQANLENQNEIWRIPGEIVQKGKGEQEFSLYNLRENTKRK